MAFSRLSLSHFSCCLRRIVERVHTTLLCPSSIIFCLALSAVEACGRAKRARGRSLWGVDFGEGGPPPDFPELSSSPPFPSSHFRLSLLGKVEAAREDGHPLQHPQATPFSSPRTTTSPRTSKVQPHLQGKKQTEGNKDKTPQRP